MVCETYPCYVRITGSADEDEVELPTEENGTMLLSTVTAQFPNAIGLRFKSESGAWRGVRVTDGVLDAPIEGWGDTEYFITLAKAAAEKRKLDTDDGPKSKKEMVQDLIVLGLPYTSTEDDLKDHFEKYGELAHWEIKSDRETKKSKGFGFVRFTDNAAVESVLAASHTLGGRTLEVRYPRRDNQQQMQQEGGAPTKLFIGRLPRGATIEDLRDCFSEYGPLKDVYIPSNFRGFGFVTFPSQYAANAALNTTHIVKGNTLNVTYPSPKPGTPQSMQMQQPQQFGYGNMQGNMQPMQGGMQGGMQGMQGGMQGSMPGGMQGGMPGGMQGGMQPMQQQGGWYGNQQKAAGYYSTGYQQPAAKVAGK